MTDDEIRHSARGMTTLDIDALTGPAAPVEHCGRPMRARQFSTSWQGEPGQGFECTTGAWECDCGATLTATVRVPA